MLCLLFTPVICGSNYARVWFQVVGNQYVASAHETFCRVLPAQGQMQLRASASYKTERRSGLRGLAGIFIHFT